MLDLSRAQHVLGGGGLAFALLAGCVPAARPAEAPGTTTSALFAVEPSLTTPLIHVRVRAIVTADDDGTERAPASAEGIVKAIEDTNRYYAPCGIHFEFDPDVDYEERNDARLNADCVLDRGDTGSPSERPPACNARASTDARARVARMSPDRMVLFFRHFKAVPALDPTTRRWKLASATGGYSGPSMPFVVVGPGSGGGTYLAHEIGHYFHLSHTFGPTPRTLEAAAEVIRHYVEAGHPVERGLDVFHADAQSIDDTPPDPAGALFIAAGLDRCGPVPTLQLPVAFAGGAYVYTVAPDRFNIMSYFKDCPFEHHNFSPRQMQRMRGALLSGNRQGVAHVDR